jgi:hypothetical protein
LRWIGFTTFIVRAYEDIVRYFIMTIAPPAVVTALYFIVFGMLIGQRIGIIGGFHYKQYIAPGLIMVPIVTSSYSQAGLSFVVAKIHRILDEHLVSPKRYRRQVPCALTPQSAGTESSRALADPYVELGLAARWCRFPTRRVGDPVSVSQVELTVACGTVGASEFRRLTDMQNGR